MTDRPTTPLDSLSLPPCLERIDGNVRITGHRVALTLIVEALADHTPFGRLCEMYPTVPPDKMRAVVEFCERHLAELSAWAADERERFEALMAERPGQGPSLAELRRRMEKRRANDRIGRGESSASPCDPDRDEHRGPVPGRAIH
jgi:uncharacterized protein (DUF433 family)